MLKFCTCGVFIAAVFAAQPAMAGPWTIPSGDGGDFTYSNGGDTNGLFGDPFVFPNQFFFSTVFVVNSSGLGSDTATDLVSFDAVADVGLFFSGVTIEAVGTFAITGDGSVDLFTELKMDENDGLLREFTTSLNTVPTFPITSGQGLWTGSGLLSLTSEFPIPSSNIHFSLETILDAVTGVGGSAQLNVQFESLLISFEVIPEPASIWLLGAGGLLCIRRRRRP